MTEIIHVTKNVDLVNPGDTIKAVCGVEFKTEENYGIEKLPEYRDLLICDACMLVLFEENLL